MWNFLFAVLLQSVWLCGVHANVGLNGADDLFKFVTRPDLMSPKWNITYYQKEQLADGYWFTTPFRFIAHHLDDVKWVPCQMGPMIYDNDGELVWSGACQFNNRIMYDLIPIELGGRTVLKAIVMNSEFPVHDCGAGLYIDQNYEMVHNFFIEKENNHVNIHDFNYIARENKTLITTRRPRRWQGTAVGLMEDLVWIDSNGIRAYDMGSGNVTFDWRAEEHISLEESTMQPAYSVALLHNKTHVPFTNFTANYLWDPWHINSVDENSDGNYLVSFRHLDTIMLIAGDDGRVLWRFGGKHDDYIHEGGFKFSRQHHARYISHTPERDVISFMDNASGEQLIDFQPPSNNYSRGLIVELLRPRDQPKRARILHEYKRPDRKLADRRGSLQRLTNGNVLMAWTDAGYISEHTADDQVVMEAKFYNETRLGIYRAYKSTNWVGHPKQPPDVRAFGYGASGSQNSMTAIYVSWNGATEHRIWKFYSNGEFLGQTNRTGFETTFVTDKPTGLVRAEAFDANGVYLGKSLDVVTEYAAGWMSVVPNTLPVSVPLTPPPPPPPPPKIDDPAVPIKENPPPPLPVEGDIVLPPGDSKLLPPVPVNERPSVPAEELLPPPPPVEGEVLPPISPPKMMPPPFPPTEAIGSKPISNKIAPPPPPTGVKTPDPPTVDKLIPDPPKTEEELAAIPPPPAPVAGEDPIPPAPAKGEGLPLLPPAGEKIDLTPPAEEGELLSPPLLSPPVEPEPTPVPSADPASQILAPIHQQPPPPPPPPPSSDPSSPTAHHLPDYRDNPLYIGVLGIPCAIGWYVILRMLYRHIRFLIASQFGWGKGKGAYYEVPQFMSD
ncbi:ASST-domain-containing protein [Xylariaceae sp. FL0255]|nr:ASST-domain-containing protein [Xylariaceae sp. FL0255]